MEGDHVAGRHRGYGVFNTLLARNPSAYVVPWVLLAPVVAMASAETAGGLLLVVGVLVAVRSSAAAARPPARRAPAGC